MLPALTRLSRIERAERVERFEELRWRRVVVGMMALPEVLVLSAEEKKWSEVEDVVEATEAV